MLSVNKRLYNQIACTRRIQNALIVETGRGIIKLEPKSEGIIRVLYTVEKEFSSEEKPGILLKDTFPDWNFEERKTEVILHTAKINLHINRETASIRYCDINGRLLLEEKEQESRTMEEFSSYKISAGSEVKVERIETPDGVKEIVKEAEKELDRKLYKTRLHLKWQKEELLYGLGQNEEGCLNLRGTTQYLHQANKKIAIPLLVSSLGYGILTDTYGPLIFNDTCYGSYLYTEADVEMDHYFIFGGNMDGVIKGYRYLSGKAVMLPKWTFGFIQSQERYESAEELENVVSQYREREIGLDGVVLDWCTWEGNLWGQKSFDKERFADPAGMVEKLHNNHVQLMISIWPNMSKECENYKEFKERDLLLPASVLYDPYKEEGRKLYWEQAEKGLFYCGLDAWWCDSSEPVTPEWSHKMEPEPSAMYHEYFDVCSKHIPAQLTNSYGLFHARTIYEGQRGVTKEKRVVNLTRNGYIGQQRYGTILWSGDISASWNVLKKQIISGLNLCASGMPYWTLDIGGFFVKKGIQWFWDGDYERGYEDLGYRELFIRWTQFGCFLPVFRSHGTDIHRELWNFGEEGELFYNALLKINRLRYRLIPYIYSMAAKVWKDDYTILRMLAFDFAQDKIACLITDQYLFGDSLMVCPVTVPMYYEKDSRVIEGADKAREVYLPIGTGWYDYWTNRYYEGGQHIKVEAPMDRIPLFVKEGSILPMVQSMQYVDEVPEAIIELHIYSGKDGEFELYEDEGNGYGYEEGEFVVTRVAWSEKEKKLTVNKPVGSYKGFVNSRSFNSFVIDKK